MISLQSPMWLKEVEVDVLLNLAVKFYSVSLSIFLLFRKKCVVLYRFNAMLLHCCLL